LTLEQNT